MAIIKLVGVSVTLNYRRSTLVTAGIVLNRHDDPTPVGVGIDGKGRNFISVSDVQYRIEELLSDNPAVAKSLIHEFNKL